MAKAKNNSEVAKRNRNNRMRGAKFEKKVAEILDMSVVPYSGSNARFGWSDVRDSEDKNKSIWMGECKNITIKDGETSVTIKREWLTKNDERAYGSKAIPFLAFMISGKPEKYIVLDENVMTFISHELGHNGSWVADYDITYEKKSHNTTNLIIPLSDLKLINISVCNLPNAGMIKVRNYGDKEWYTIMSIEAFDNIINQIRIHYKYMEV